MAHPKFKITGKESGDSSSVVSVTDNKLDVNATLSVSDDIEIGNVDIKLDGTAVSANNGAADTGTVRVTVASDSTGVLSVDDNGGSITVDGTVDLGATATTHLSEIEGAVETIEGAVSGSEMQVDIVSGTVTANLGTADNAVLDDISSNTEDSKILLDNWDSGDDSCNVAVNTAVHPAGMNSITSYDRFDVDTSAIRLSSADGINEDPVISNCKEIIIHSMTSNDGYIFVGDSNVSIDNNGIRVNAGDTLILPVADTADIWLEGSSNNQWVVVTIIRDV